MTTTISYQMNPLGQDLPPAIYVAFMLTTLVHSHDNLNHIATDYVTVLFSLRHVRSNSAAYLGYYGTIKLYIHRSTLLFQRPNV